MRKFALFFLISFSLFLFYGCARTTHIIHFDTLGGNIIEDIILDQYETLTSIPIPIKEGYTFEGWYIDDDYVTPFVIDETALEKEMTLYAKWNRIILNVTINFNVDGGSAISPYVYPPGVSIAAPANPTKIGNTFSGWYTNQNLTSLYVFTTMPEASMTLYAKWTPNSYTITFQTNGGSILETIDNFYGAIIEAPINPTKDQHTFIGWYKDSEYTEAFEFTTMPDSNIMIYAKWETSEVTIIFESEGGSAVLPIHLAPGASVDAPTNPTKEGYLFSGWFTSIESIDLYSFDVMPNSNITLFADWATEGLSYELIDNLYYEVSSGTANELVEIFIPKYYLGTPVQSIAIQGFAYCSQMESIHLPETLKRIKSSAFLYASSLKSLHIPASVSMMDTTIFRFTNQLEEITVDLTSMHYKSLEGVLFSKDGTTLIRYPANKSNTEYIIGNYVLNIGSDAFSNSHHLTSIIIGSSVNTIGDHAFYDCIGLTSMVIPDSVTNVEIYIFRDCIHLVSVQLGSGITAISAYMFNGCVSLISIIIPFQVLSIGYGAFYDCISLSTMHLKRDYLSGITTGALFMLSNTPLSMKIYVENEMSLDAYKLAYHWSSYKTRMEVKP
ncbi:MAG: InlB B-repeat-containing protein [Acholeplasmataceae bacterium]|nr:InlB B-repeat-containing protein [Acholeplasmataceae bacterium]